MLVIIIRLVGEQDDRLFRCVEVDNEVSYVDLMKKIEIVTQIPIVYQEIKMYGHELPNSLQPLFSAKDFDEIVVCHTMLANWRTYIQMINAIKQLTTSGVTTERREIALKARMQLSPLFSSKFFVVYPNLTIEELNISKNLNFLIHNTRKYLVRSVLTYFKTLYPNQKVELRDKSEESAGIHLGVFVLVDDVASYYAKTLGSIPGPDEEIDFPNRPTVDLMEIFVYVLLKLIGLGSMEVHVISDVNNSEFVFIATKLIYGFRTASGVSVDQMLEGNSAEKTETVLVDMEMRRQMRILSSLLCLSDLQKNKGNHGVVEVQAGEVEKREGRCSTCELRIIDFKVNLGFIEYEPTIFNSTADAPFLKSYFEKWDMLKNIYKAKEEMENNPALKNNKNVNKRTFDCYFKRLETTLGNFLSN